MEENFPEFRLFKDYKAKDYKAAMAFMKDMFQKAKREDGTSLIGNTEPFYRANNHACMLQLLHDSYHALGVHFSFYTNWIFL